MGIILFELLALERPFKVKHSAYALSTKIIEDDPDPLPDDTKNRLRDDVAELPFSILKKDPEARPSVSKILEIPCVKCFINDEISHEIDGRVQRRQFTAELKRLEEDKERCVKVERYIDAQKVDTEIRNLEDEIFRLKVQKLENEKDIAKADRNYDKAKQIAGKIVKLKSVKELKEDKKKATSERRYEDAKTFHEKIEKLSKAMESS